ncbi:MAG: hypothetical protein SGI77_07620 [Pirellulaceae bacterium]|nr:hypothetical protein [Pirellulaceae bacterium]
MKSYTNTVRLLAVITAVTSSRLLLADGTEYQSEMFKNVRLVYEDTFDGPLNSDFWEIRQSSTWVIKDGILIGGQSSKTFQETMIAKGDKAHAGFKPVIWLKQVPENFVCSMRMRYDAKAYDPRFPILDLGHHIHTLTFGEKLTTLTIKKDVETIKVEEPFLPLNQWLDVAIELKKGTLVLKIDGKKKVFQSPNIDMAGQAQIDFKGVDYGTCQIDNIKLWEGK